MTHTYPCSNSISSLLRMVLALGSLISIGAFPAAGGPCTSSGFNLPATFPAYREPAALVVSDLNGDGRSDLAIVTTEFYTHVGSVTTLIDDGAGGFVPNNFFLGQYSSTAIVAEDFNNDQIIDLVTTNAASNTISVLLGTGSGGFNSPNHFGAGTSPSSIAAGDFNADGKLDVVTRGGSIVSILLGNGAGDFAVSNSYTLGAGIISNQAVVVGYFNADTKLDVVMMKNSSNVSFLPGDGMGGLGPATDFPVGSYIDSIEKGDFNNDTKTDLAVTHDGDVSILLGDGAGGFGPPINTLTPNNSQAIAVDDFNTDGKADLAVTDGGVTVLLGDGTGNFGTVVSYVPGGGSIALATGDFNSDTKTDLAVAYSNANGALQNSVGIFRGTGDGSFNSVVTTTAGAGMRPDFIVKEDFNGDGNLDLAVSNENGNNVSVLLGDGMGNFGAPSHFAVGTRPYSVVVADFNHDNKADLATANIDAGSVSILLGNGAGSFAPSTNIGVGTLPRYIAVGDYNGDGNPDLAVTRFVSSNSGKITILLGNGMGGFGAPNDRVVPFFAGFILAHDFNHDDKTDLVMTAEYGGQISILFGDGMGGFGVPVDYIVANLPLFIAISDFNSDDEADLAVANTGGNSVSILLGEGAGGFSAANNYIVKPAANFDAGTGPVALAVSDFNLDGKLDIATANYGEPSHPNTVSILDGDGMGGFGPPLIIEPGRDARSIVAGDLNNDGKPDLALANHESDSIKTLLNNAASLADLSVTKTDSPDPVLIGNNLTYTLTVKNNGPSSSTGVVAIDQLPPGVTFISATSTVGSCTRAGSIVTCNIGNLADGLTATITITVKPNVAGTLSNTVHVSGNECDSNAINDTASQVTTAVKLLSFVLSPRTVPGCQRVTATLTLSGPAPAGGVVVTLTDTLAALNTPASVNIPAGTTSKTFMITTNPVNATQNGTVKATLGTVTLSKPLTVRPIGVQTLVLNPNPVVGPHAVTGIVTLECPAPAGGIVVALSSSNAGVAAPAVNSINIPAGTKSKSFTVHTMDVPAPRSATIKATANGISKSVILTVN